MTESKILYVGDIPKKAGIGTVLIKLPQAKDKVGRFFIPNPLDYADNDLIKNWEKECEYISKEIIATNEKARRNKMNDRELAEYIKKHHPPKPQPKPQLGVDRYNIIYGEVLELPRRMPLDKKTKKVLPCEIQKGDIVYFHYLTLKNAEDWHQNGALGDDWAIIDYSGIFFVKRNEEVVMVNGYVLLEEIEDEPLSKIIETPKRISTKKGIVAHAPEGSELKKGQVVYWVKNSNVKLEYELIQTMPKPYLRIREEFIIGIEE